MYPQIVFGREHQPLDQSENSNKIGSYLFGNSSHRKKRETLGLHRTKDGICPGNYIGAVWMASGDNSVALCVNSKFDNPKMDYMAMFVECCADFQVSEKIHDCFYVWPEKELIEIPDAKLFSFMIVVAFLQRLNTLCARHLRRHFHLQRKNFTGKVKGKIIISENLRRNVGHAERMFCEYQAISDDILENRILRAALEKAACYLSTEMAKVKDEKKMESYSILQRWVHACRSHLQGVSVVHIAKRDFGAARQRGAFALYQRPLHLAKAILCHFGFNPHEEWKEITKTPPHAIDSAKLFEFFVEIRLRRKYPKISVQTSAGNQQGGFTVNVRPDFGLLRQGTKLPMIVDAKYKDLRWVMEKGRKNNSDLYQMIAYSQHLGLLQKLNENVIEKEGTDGIKLCLAYPWLKGMEKTMPETMLPWYKKRFTDAFNTRIRFCRIKCPAVSDSKE